MGIGDWAQSQIPIKIFNYFIYIINKDSEIIFYSINMLILFRFIYI